MDMETAKPGSSSGGKRKLLWTIKEEEEEDSTDGKHRKVTTSDVSSAKDQSTIAPKHEGELSYKAFLEEYKMLSSRPAYDVEAITLGLLPKSLYLQIPNCWATEICPIENVCAGAKYYNPSINVLASVYTLAKRQYEAKRDKDIAVKWATLRLEAFKAGWFDNQEYTIRVDAPKDALTVFEADSEEIVKHTYRARKISSFVPFLTEFCFRTYGSAYGESSAGEFLVKATRLAKSSGHAEVLDYLPCRVLFGQALRWVELKRPMLVLKNPQAGPNIPEVFRERAKWGPAGQAAITLAHAVIGSMETEDWWSVIKKIGGYDDTVLNEVAASITVDPWKYHMYSSFYGFEGLSEEETKRVKEAKDSAVMFAPVLQAYCDTVKRSSGLGKGKALKKFAEQNLFVYKRAVYMFRSSSKSKNKGVSKEEQVSNMFVSNISFESLRGFFKHKGQHVDGDSQTSL